MPQHINVAVIASDSQRLEVIRKALELPEDGIYPRYYFATPEDNIEKLVNPKNYPFGHVDLWISLDLVSHEFCQKKHSENLRDPNFDRGYYDQFLPTPVIDIVDDENTIEVLRAQTKEILEAFCKTS